MFAWSQLEFSAIPAVSLAKRQTWQNVTIREGCKKFEMYRKGKGTRKKRHLPALLSLFLLWGEVSKS
jgi:hypothetical protein